MISINPDNKASDQVTESERAYNAIHQKTFLCRVAGFLGGATLGAGIGGVIGAVAAFLPYVLGVLSVAGAAPVALPAISAIAASVALFASVGGGMGVVVGADVGANAGSNAAAFEIEKKNGKEQKPAPAKEESKSPKWYDYNWKSAPVFVALFAAFGAIMALSPLTAPAVALLGFKGAVAATATTAAQPATAAAIAASASVLGMFGAAMPVKGAIIHNKLSNFYMDLLTGGGEAKDAPSQQVQPVVVKIVQAPALGESPEKTRTFAAAVRPFSLEGILNKTEECSHPEHTILR